MLTSPIAEFRAKAPDELASENPRCARPETMCRHNLWNREGGLLLTSYLTLSSFRSRHELTCIQSSRALQVRSCVMESEMRFASLIIAMALAISAATPAMACYKMTCNSPVHDSHS
jgi:hypothetical protein